MDDVIGVGLTAAYARWRGTTLGRVTVRVETGVAVTVLCFVPDAGRAVAEMARVLVPGGRLVIGELSRRSIWAGRRRVRGWLGDTTWRRARFWTRAELARACEDAGLRVTGARGCVFYPPSGVAARALAPIDPLLGRLHAPGAAFIAVSARRSEHA